MNLNDVAADVVRLAAILNNSATNFREAFAIIHRWIGDSSPEATKALYDLERELVTLYEVKADQFATYYDAVRRIGKPPIG